MHCYSFLVVLLTTLTTILMSPAPTYALQVNNSSIAHPCLLVNAASLPRIKAKAADAKLNKFGFKTADVWSAIKQRADKLAALPTYTYSVAIPGEGGITLQNWSYTLSDRDPPHHDKSPSYPPWTAMFQEREDSISTRLIHFSFAYLMTDDERYFQKAREIALHLTNWKQWTDPSYGAGNIKACLDTGHCTYAMAMFYDWCFSALTDGEKIQVRQAILSKGIEPIMSFIDRYPAEANAYAVVLSGATLAAIALRPEEPRCNAYITQCIAKIRTALDKGGSDGGPFEGPTYGTYLLDSLALCFEALESARVKHDLLQHSYITTMPRYCLGLLAPDTKQIPCFSDGSPAIAVPRLMSIIAHRGNKEAAYYLQIINALKPAGIYDFIRFESTQLNPKPPSWNPSSVFTDIGYASLRDKFNTQAPSLFFKSGPTTEQISHNHFDHNSFVISYRGQWLVPDRGYQDLYVPARRKFSLGTIGHSSIVLDVDDAWMQNTAVPSPGHDQVNRAGGRIAEFFAGNSFDYVKGEAASPYNTNKARVLDRFSRSIIYVKPHFFIIRDDLAAPKPHAYSFLLHSDRTGDIDQDGNFFKITRSNSQLLVRTLSSSPTTSHIGKYPGAENYGPFLRLETTRATTATFTTFLYPQSYQDTKLIRNGGFESGMVNWMPRSGGDLDNHTIVSSDSVQGRQSARIKLSGYYYSDKFALPVGTTITAKVKVRTEDTPVGRGAVIRLHFWKGGVAFTSVMAGPFNTSQWSEQVISATVPPETEAISLALEYFAPGAANFDDVRIETNADFAKSTTPIVKALSSDGLDIAIGRERYVVLCGRTGRYHEAADLKTDAAIAVVGFDSKGKPVSAFLQKGTKILWRGKTLLALSQIATAEVHFKNGKLTAQIMNDVKPHASLPARAALICIWKPMQAMLNGRRGAVRSQAIGTRISS